MAESIAEPTPEGECSVHLDGVQEVVADKGYHSNEVVLGLDKLEVRTYIAEPDRGPRSWLGKAAEKAAVYGNRRGIQGNVRGKENVHKKFLIQAAACNLALLMRSMYGSGKPRAAHDRIVDAILTILALMKAVEDILTASSAMFYRERRISRGSDRCH